MGLYVWPWCWVKLILVTQSREIAVVIQTRSERWKKQSWPYIYTVWVQRHRNWFQKGNRHKKHQCSNLLKNCNNLPETPGLQDSHIHLSWSARSQMEVFRWKQLIILFLCTSCLHINFCSGSWYFFGLWGASNAITHSLQSQHRRTPYQLWILIDLM